MSNTPVLAKPSLLQPDASSQTPLEIAREYFPGLADSALTALLWERTGFPGFWPPEDGTTPAECLRTQLARLRDGQDASEIGAGPLWNWPRDAVMVVGSRPGTENRATMTVPASDKCRACHQEIIVDMVSVAQAEGLPERSDRPVLFFCVACAARHDLAGVNYYNGNAANSTLLADVLLANSDILTPADGTADDNTADDGTDSDAATDNATSDKEQPHV